MDVVVTLWYASLRQVVAGEVANALANNALSYFLAIFAPVRRRSDEIGDLPLDLQAKLLRVLQKASSNDSAVHGRSRPTCECSRSNKPRIYPLAV